MARKDDDARLMLRYRDGDGSTSGALYAHHQGPLHRYLLRYVAIAWALPVQETQAPLPELEDPEHRRPDRMAEFEEQQSALFAARRRAGHNREADVEVRRFKKVYPDYVTVRNE